MLHAKVEKEKKFFLLSVRWNLADEKCPDCNTALTELTE